MSASKELGSGSLNPANTLRKLKIKPRWFLPFLPLFLVLGSLPAVRVLSKLYNTDDTVPDDGGNNRNEPRKQPHHHPLSKENENITEADLLNRCCIWTHKQKEGYLCSMANIVVLFHTHSVVLSSNALALAPPVYGGWDFRTSNRSHPDSLNLASFGGPAPAIRASKDDMRNSWNESASFYAAENWGISGSLPPLMYWVAPNHPAHCLQDVIFSLLPMAYRGELKGVILVDIESADIHPPDNTSYCNQ
eukprot:scaffold11760_cov69-Cyclotella_meneghiniana.AAC.1